MSERLFSEQPWGIVDTLWCHLDSPMHWQFFKLWLMTFLEFFLIHLFIVYLDDILIFFRVNSNILTMWGQCYKDFLRTNCVWKPRNVNFMFFLFPSCGSFFFHSLSLSPWSLQTIHLGGRPFWQHVGGHVSQRSATDNKVHPCAFFSWCLSPAEQSYDMGNCELLACEAGFRGMEALVGGYWGTLPYLDRP